MTESKHSPLIKSEMVLLEKLTKEYLREETRILLSFPIPMSYEVWSELHRYLEELE